MTDKQLQDARERWEAEKSAARSSHIDRVPDWAIAQAFRDALDGPSDFSDTPADFIRSVEKRARELSAQQPERYKFVTDAENGGGEIVDTSDNTSLAICWNGSETDALKIVSALNAQQAAAARGIPNTPGLMQRWNTAGDATEWVKPKQPARDGDAYVSGYVHGASDYAREPFDLSEARIIAEGSAIHNGYDQPPQQADGEAVGITDDYALPLNSGEFAISFKCKTELPIGTQIYLRPPRGVEVTDGYDPNELLRAARHLIGGLMGGGKTDSGDLVLVDRIDQHLAALSGVQR